MALGLTTRTSTIPEDEDHRLESWAQKALIALLIIFVIAGATGFLGFRGGTVSDSGEGFDLEVDYPDETRGGLASPWKATVHREGGFDEPILLGVTAAYFEAFDINGFYPTPVAQIPSGDLLLMEFEPPNGDTLEVHFDARAQPDLQSGMDVVTAVVVEGVPVASVSYSMEVSP